MFGNVEEMKLYVGKLQDAKYKFIEEKLKSLDNKCEACKNNDVEIEYRYSWYCDEIQTENGVKLTIYNHLFCIPCYKHIMKTKQLEKSCWMEEEDKEIFGDEYEEVFASE